MIEFYGELSEKCKLERAKKISRRNGFMFLITTILISIPALILGILNNAWYYALILIAILLIVTIVAFFVPKNQNIKIPIKLLIVNNKISTTALGAKEATKFKSLERVKKVVDMGEWYDIIFKFGDISNSLVCQKNLIVQGTIEEFETIFKDKIVRKNI